MKILVDTDLLYNIYEFLNDSNVANTFMKHQSAELGAKLKKYILRGDVCDNHLSDLQSRATREQNSSII